MAGLFDSAVASAKALEEAYTINRAVLSTAKRKISDEVSVNILVDEEYSFEPTLIIGKQHGRDLHLNKEECIALHKYLGEML